MRAINDEVADALEPSRPDHPPETLQGFLASACRRGRRRYGEICGKNLHGRERRNGVFTVERTGQGEVSRDLVFRRQVRRVIERRTDLFRPGFYHRADRRFVSPKDDRYAGLDDAGLFRGDLLDRVAEPVAMVKPDLRDDAQLRLADVRRIKTAAESAFENGIIDLRLGIEEIRNGGEGLEEGRFKNIRMFDCFNV